MGYYEDVFTAAFWGNDPPPQPHWVEWKHISYGLSHCPVCLKLDKCWFADDNKPLLPQHPHCHCIVEPIPISLVIDSAKAVSSINILYKVYDVPSYDKDNIHIFQKKFEQQALDQYVAGKYILGKLDKDGQKIRIELDIKRHDNEAVRIDTEWMVTPHGKLLLIEADLNEKNYTVRVGRWMSHDEYDLMVKTGRVQESKSSTTHVAFPASPSVFEKQAKPGSIYVEFDVPSSSVKATGNGWGKIIGPNSLEGRLAYLKGLPLPQMPEASNIKIVGVK